MRKLALHWQILLGMLLGVLFGVGANYLGYVNQTGTIFYDTLEVEDASFSNILNMEVKNLSTGKKEVLKVLLEERVSNVTNASQTGNSQASKFFC